ncbi:MAG: EVE domain-containing protein [Acidobacteriota bacterium]|nr:EVE domain-containing protein [Acidobacteriota bacterium]
MAQPFFAGDDLIFQLESGFGLLRVLKVEEREGMSPVWHLMAYEELFPDVETAEAALRRPETLHVRKAHMALTDRAFERTPAARLGNRPISEEELSAYKDWAENDGTVSDRSALLMLGLR